MFRNDKFPGFKHPYNLFEYFQNKGINSNNTLQKHQNTNGSIKEETFLNKLYSSHRERKKVPVCEMREFSGSLLSCMLPVSSWKLKIIADRGSSPVSSWKLKIIPYRGSSMIPPSSKLELLCQYEMISIVTKNSIIDDLGVRDPPLVCLFSVQNITKKIKT